MSVICPFSSSEPKSSGALRSQMDVLPLCSLSEGGELLPPSPVNAKRWLVKLQEKVDLWLCSILHGSDGKGIIIATRSGMLHRWGFSQSLICLCWVRHGLLAQSVWFLVSSDRFFFSLKLEKRRLTYNRHGQYMQNLPHGKTVSSIGNNPFIPIIYSEVITKFSISQFSIC